VVLTDDYTQAIHEAVSRHFLVRMNGVYPPPMCRSTLYRIDENTMTPWLRCEMGQVGTYEDKRLRYPRGTMLIGYAWEKPGIPTVLRLGHSRDAAFFEDALRMPRPLAQAVASDPAIVRIEAILAVGIPHAPYVLCVESCQGSILGHVADEGAKSPFYLMHADALRNEVLGFGAHL